MPNQPTAAPIILYDDARPADPAPHLHSSCLPKAIFQHISKGVNSVRARQRPGGPSARQQRVDFIIDGFLKDMDMQADVGTTFDTMARKLRDFSFMGDEKTAEAKTKAKAKSKAKAKYGIGLMVFDKSHHPELLYLSIPPKFHPDKNIPRYVKLVYFDGHVELADNTRSWEHSEMNQLIKTKYEPDAQRTEDGLTWAAFPRKSVLTKPSNHFPVKHDYFESFKRGPLVSSAAEFDRELNDFCRQVKEDTKAPERMTIYIQAPFAVRSVYNKLVKAHILPECNPRKATEVTNFRLSFQVKRESGLPPGQVTLTVRAPCESKPSIAFESMEQLELYKHMEARLRNLKHKQRNLSYYARSPVRDDLAYMDEWVMGVIPHGCTIRPQQLTDEEKNHIRALDANKFYTYCEILLIKMAGGLPVRTAYATREAFDGRVRMDYEYMVVLTDNHPLNSKKKMRLPGCVLKRLMEMDADLPEESQIIYGVVGQERMLIAPAAEVAQELQSYHSPAGKYKTLPKDLIKFTPHMCNGISGTKFNRHKHCETFPCELDASTYANQLKRDKKAEIVSQEYDEENRCMVQVGAPTAMLDVDGTELGAYIVRSERSSRLKNGFIPMREWVLAVAFLRMYELYFLIMKHNGQVVGFKTDAVYYIMGPEDYQGLLAEMDALGELVQEGATGWKVLEVGVGEDGKPTYPPKLITCGGVPLWSYVADSEEDSEGTALTEDSDDSEGRSQLWDTDNEEDYH